MVPSGENATEETSSVCPSRVAIFVCVAASHSLTVPSADAEATMVPSGENATEVTACVCPAKVAVFVRVATFHSLTILSFDPEASSIPSRENATEKTSLVCPSRIAAFPVATSHSLTVPSSDAVARVPSDENATDLTPP